MNGERKRTRYAIIDDVRGLIVISMIIYHAVWNMVNLFGAKWHWYQSDWAYLWQQSICWGFILLSGFCWSFSRKQWKRGTAVFASGLLVSAVTALLMPENIILFGVLTCLGSCMLLMIPLQKITSICNPQTGMLMSFAMFVLLRNINEGRLGFEQWDLIQLPEKWYANLFTAYLGFPPDWFCSADYFSLFPWMFLFLTGYFIGRIVRRKEWLSLQQVSVKGCMGAGLEWVGRHSLLIYLLHQPLLYAVLFICCK